MNATERAMRMVRALWHLAEWRQILASAVVQIDKQRQRDLQG